MNKFVQLLSRPAIVLGGVVLVSVAALATAFTAENVFGLAPCPLCIYQRAPFALVALIGLVAMVFRRNETIMTGAVGASGLLFLANSALAFYHSGVERHWWQSAIEGCVVSFEESNETLLNKILSTPAARCNEIPWADPFLGLSMANYNVILCLVLFCVCMLSCFCIFLTREKNAA
jgi:disulfide bond formation protein DsbB